MNVSDRFIERPVLSGVVAILVTLLGAIAIPGLPIAQYPDLALPEVSVNATYVGASAEVVETAVTLPLEQELNGVEGMLYMSSSSSADGRSRVTITFSADRDVDLAAVDVQNRVSTASPRLPAEVNATGVIINKAQTQQLMSIGFFSDDDRYDPLFLSNYLNVNVVDPLKRITGVGEVRIYGERRFAMRLWLDPAKLAARQLSAQDVVAALREQNIQVAAGTVGQPPTAEKQPYQLSVRATGRLEEPGEFEGLILRRGPDGSLVRLSDVGRAELGAENYQQLLRFNGHPGVGLGIFQLPQANALDVRERVVAELERLAEDFPPGLQFEPANDTTRAIEESLNEVVRALIEAIGLVILVIFLFLHRFRSLLIVALTLPVSLVGTFAFVAAFGFSLTTLTLFGLTLATGLVVDDAIVVIENIERLIESEHLSPREAARKGMAEVSGPVVAMTLVLIAVFIPVAFFPGTTGSIYQQFALTIAFSISLSMLTALTLSPALCALLLSHRRERRGVFRWIQRKLDALREGYGRGVHWLLARRGWVLAAFAILSVVTVWLYRSVPQAFIPDEDQGYMIVAVQGPEGTSLDYTSDVLARVEQVLRAQPEVIGMFVVGGFSFAGNGPNYGTVFVTLSPWHDRKGPDQSVAALVRRLRDPFSAIGEATVLPLQPPAIRGVGSIGGFQFMLQDRSGTASLDALAQTTQAFVARANQSRQLEGVFSTFAASTPILQVTVDRERVKAAGVELDDLYGTLQILLGSQYVNDFDFAGRTYRVYVQADAPYRNAPDDIASLYVRNDQGAMIPLESLVEVRSETSAQTIRHYNLFRATEINGGPAPGTSTGEALAAMEQVAEATLSRDYAYEWTGASREQLESAGQAPILFGLAVVFVFLLLAALYESFVLPLVILLSVPLAILGALGFQALRGLPNDVFCQIGLVMLVGLASKNAILIVEFAEKARAQGRDLTSAAVEAAQLRLRPILMTSFALIFGVLPLVLATGAGAAARQSLGTAVFGGMFVSTLINLAFIPVLYVVITSLRERLHWPGRARRRARQPAS
ncbi:MAG: multidrug efflux RND transporter permease subunit [Myxococcaceae bacterium]